MSFLKSPLPSWCSTAFAIALLACNSGPPNFGAPCGEGVACTGGLACVTLPGGYCSARCGPGVPCAEGGVCDPLFGGGLCLAACASDSTCRDGYQCWRGGCRAACGSATDCGGGEARCIDGRCEGPECSTPDDCGPGRTCAGGVCVDAEVDAGPLPDGGGTTADGQPCTRDEACVSGICLPAARGGICTRACTDATSCINDVPFVSGCAPVLIGTSSRALCVPFDAAGRTGGEACASDAQCAIGLCAEGLCSEVCDDATDCTAGELCTNLPWSGVTFMGCGFPPRAGAVEILELDLGTLDLPAGSGTRDLRVGVPADAVSLTLRAVRTGGDVLEMAYYAVDAPDGTSLFDLGGFSDLVDQTIRWYPGDGTEAITMLVPNTTEDRFAFQIGRYPYGIAVYGSAGRVTVRVSALVKRAASRAVSAGTLDIAVHLVGVGVTAAGAPSSTRVQNLLSRFGDILRGAGVTIGTVSYHDVPGSTLSVIDSVRGSSSELAELFRTSAGRTGRVLPLFLVRGIMAGGDGFNTLGIAGGIPGSTGIYGTENSGVVVSFDPAFVGTSTAAGHVAAHESGHFLGLFHVTERVRACAMGEDPVTAMCAPFGGTDVIFDTTRGDTSNLMHWSIVGAGSNDGLSAGQSFALLRSPLVR